MTVPVFRLQGMVCHVKKCTNEIQKFSFVKYCSKTIIPDLIPVVWYATTATTHNQKLNMK